MDIEGYVESLVEKVLANGQHSETDAGRAGVEQSTAILNSAGVRIMRLAGQFTIGIWSDLDGPEIHTALRSLDMDRQPVRYLDGDGIPARFKVRRVDGEPASLSALS